MTGEVHGERREETKRREKKRKGEGREEKKCVHGGTWVTGDDCEVNGDKGDEYSGVRGDESTAMQR